MSSVGKLSPVPLNQERGHTQKERRVSKDRKTNRKEMSNSERFCSEVKDQQAAV